MNGHYLRYTNRTELYILIFLKIHLLQWNVDIFIFTYEKLKTLSDNGLELNTWPWWPFKLNVTWDMSIKPPFSRSAFRQTDRQTARKTDTNLVFRIDLVP